MLNQESTSLARVVLHYIEWMTGDDDLGISVYPYHNGREHGFALTAWPAGAPSLRLAVFAEFRRSDEIVLYMGAPEEFDSNYSPLDGVYERAEFFAADKGARAASAALRYLRQVE